VESPEGRDPNTVTFNYRTEKSKPLGKIKRPVAKVYFKTRSEKWLPCFMYIDSGADFTLIPYRFGLMLGLKMEKGVTEIYGVGGGVPVLLKSTSMKVGEITLSTRVGWSLREDVPFILGRLDVFDKFNVHFRQKEGKVIFELVNENTVVR